MNAGAAEMFNYKERPIHQRIIKCNTVSPEYQVVYLPSISLSEELDRSVIDKWKNMDFDSYTEYQKFIQKVHRIVFYPENFMRSKCSCVTYLKEYMCKHILYVAVLGGKHTIPDGDDYSTFKKTRLIGRPKKRKGALQKE